MKSVHSEGRGSILLRKNLVRPSLNQGKLISGRLFAPSTRPKKALSPRHHPSMVALVMMTSPMPLVQSLNNY